MSFMSSTIVLEGELPKVWSAVQKIVVGAGYVVSDIDQAGKSITYQAKASSTCGAQSIEVVLSQVDEGQVMAMIKCEPLDDSGVFMRDTYQNQLIEFLETELEKRFTIIESDEAVDDAPGTTEQGCASVVMWFLIAASAAVANACLMM